MQKTVQKIQPVFLSFNDGSSSQCSPHLLIVPLGISLSSFLALFFLLSFLVLFCTVYIRVRFVLVLYNQEIESLTRIKYRWASQREREREREGGGEERWTKRRRKKEERTGDARLKYQRSQSPRKLASYKLCSIMYTKMKPKSIAKSPKRPPSFDLSLSSCEIPPNIIQLTNSLSNEI